MTDRVALTAPDRLEVRRVFPVSPERLWAFLTDPELRQTWFCAGEMEPRVGGKAVLDFDHRRITDTPPPETYKDAITIRFEGEILEWEPPRRLAFSWPETDGLVVSRVTMILTPVDGGTELHLVHDGLTRAADHPDFAAGWHSHFDLLADLFAGRPLRDFWQRHEETEADYRETLAAS